MCIATRFFIAFKEKHPNAKIEFIAFTLLKPWFVRCMREWTSCCCRYHVELVELRIGLNNMRSKIGGFHANCDCDYRCVGFCGPLGVNQNVGECCAN